MKYAREERERLHARAVKLEKQGLYSQSQIFLLKWFLEGDCEEFWNRKEEGERIYAAVWDAITASESLREMTNHPTWKYVIRCIESDEMVFDDIYSGTAKDKEMMDEADPVPARRLRGVWCCQYQ